MASKVLLVEDDDFMRDMIRMVLDSQGYLTSEAASREDALRKWREEADFQAAVCDLYLPDGNGLELFDTLNEERPGLRFLLLTGETDGQVRRQAAARGVRHIPKDENFAEAIIDGLRAE